MSVRVLTEAENIESEYRSFFDSSLLWLVISLAVWGYVGLLDIFVETPKVVYSFIRMFFYAGVFPFIINIACFRSYARKPKRYNWRFAKALKLYSVLNTALVIILIGLVAFLLPALWSHSVGLYYIGMVCCIFGVIVVYLSPFYALYLQKNKSPELNHGPFDDSDPKTWRGPPPDSIVLTDLKNKDNP